MRERMGSGGPRGLQILRSGVNRVRGGFDSHAFPPLFVALTFLVLTAAAVGAGTSAPGGGATASGTAAAADTLPAALAADTTKVERAENRRPLPAPAAGGTARGISPASVPAAEGTFDKPRWVMMRSLLIPGWGQLHNHAFLKAGAFAGVEGWLGARLIRDSGSLDRLRRDVDAARSAGDDAGAAAAVEAYNRRLDRIVSGQWMLAGVVTYALLDAYVDAHFRHFKVEFEHDPALPEGFSSGTGARLLLRWGF